MTETERYAWIQLALTPYVGAETFLKLIQHFGTAEHALNASVADIQAIVPNKKLAQSWRDTSVAQLATDQALEWEQGEGCRVLILADDDYPMMLTEGITPPPILFTQGRIGLLHRPAVSVVGSRNASAQAVRIAQDFSQALSERGITIVSGMALGIDTAAHVGALGFAGSTIAFWGTGMNRIYPPENRLLAEQIAEQGVIVSEFPLNTHPLASHFPRRNRLIAAQGLVTLVVEATLQSGSLITAKQAMEMGRDVMAIPHSIDNPLGKGCLKLIKEGAKLVENIDDIIQECPALLPENMHAVSETQAYLSTKISTPLLTTCSTTTSRLQIPKTPTKNSVEKPQKNNFVDNYVDKIGDNSVDKSLLVVLEKMGYEPIHPDSIADWTQLPTSEVYAILLELELLGKISAVAGGRYQRIS